MMLGRSLFTTKGTIVERKVNDLNIGYVSGETKEEIYNTIKDLNPEDMVEKGILHMVFGRHYFLHTLRIL